MIVKIGFISWLILTIDFAISFVIGPLFVVAFNVDIFQYIDPMLMLRIGVISFVVCFLSVMWMVISDTFS